MAELKWSRGAGRERIKIFLSVVVITVLGLSSAWGQAGFSSVSVEIATAKQYVRVVLPPSDESNLVIHFDQFESDVMNGVRVPREFVGVGNLQIFAGGKRVEKIDFSNSPMHIILGNPQKLKKPVTSFGLLGKDRSEWVFWKDGRYDELTKLGFEGDFYPGDPAILIVRKWPSGDPCISR